MAIPGTKTWKRAVCTFAWVFAGVVADPAAQEWRKEMIADAGVQIDAPGRLERLPMQLGDNAMYHVARFRPKDDKDFVRGQYYWYCDVYQFSKKDPKPDDRKFPDDMPPEVRKQLEKLMDNPDFKPVKSFKDYLAREHKTRGTQITMEQEGKARKGKPGKLDFAHWMWLDASGFGPAGIVYCEAAVFSFEDREVALVIEMPLETDKPPKPKSKWKAIIDRMIASGEGLDAGSTDLDTDKKRDQYANTPDRITALEAAKKNIQGLKGWDYFTSPNYIVVYSWDFEKPLERSKSKKDAEYYSGRLEKMRELYLGNYPLDETGTKAVFPDPKSIPTVGGPTTGAPQKPDPEDEDDGIEEKRSPTEKLGVVHYPVFRLCATYDQFMKYGQSPPGVVGWFSPASKELVVFLGGDKMMGQGATETVTFHEGWHQYADFYFAHPQTAKRGTLHRWFDEAHGDFFGSYRWGTGGWKYVGNKMRHEDCRNMVRVGDYVPWKEIVHWNRQRFYSQKAPYYYAQAYSMIDFLRRGEKSPGWQPRWGGILDMYRKVMLVHGNGKLASETAFFEFKDEDWKAIEDAWKAWVLSPQFLNGK